MSQWGAPGSGGQNPGQFQGGGFGQQGFPGAQGGFGQQGFPGGQGGFGQQGFPGGQGGFGQQGFPGGQPPQGGGFGQQGFPGGPGAPGGPGSFGPGGMPPGQFPPPQPPKKKRNVGQLFLIGAVAVVALVAMIAIGNQVSEPEYANDDYEPAPASDSPPPFDEPSPDATVDGLLEQNEIYGQQIATPTRCELAEIDPNAASDAEVEAHIDELMGCLMRVWDPAFAETQYTLVRPKVNIYHDEVSTPCNSGEAVGVNALYCPANQEVYWSRQLSEVVPEYGAPHAMDMVMAHEFGHAVQARSNIAVAWQTEATQTASESDMMELSRRSESQADCFAGMFMSSAAQSMDFSDADFQSVLAATRSGGADVGSGDPEIEATHPHADSREYWMGIGMNSAEVGSCETWSAPPETVR